MAFLNNLIITGRAIFHNTPTTVTPSTADNSTKVATTAFVKAQGYTTNTGTVTSIKIDGTPYSPTSGVINLPAYPTDTNTARATSTAVVLSSTTSFTQGTLPSLSYTSRSIPNVTNVGTLPSLSSTSYTIYPVTSATTTATKVTLGTAIAADDITSWSAGTLPSLSDPITVPVISSTGTPTTASIDTDTGILTFTVGTAPTLSDSVEVPILSSIGTLPSLSYTARSIPNVTANANITVPVLSSSVTIKGVNTWSAGTLPTLGTAITADDITTWSAGTLPTYTPSTATAVTGVGI